MKVHEVLAEWLHARGINTVFGLMGEANVQYLVDFIKAEGQQFISCPHEGIAVSMADGYHRLSGKIGVASVTHGPALTNTLTALTEAVRSRTEVLLITGSTPSEGRHLQAIDIAAIVAPTGAGYERVSSSADVASGADRALRRIALERRPVVLDLPFDLLDREAANEVRPFKLPSPATSSPDQNALDEALGMVAGARRPLVLAGRGAVVSSARDALIELADFIGAPLATTLLAKDFFRGHKRHVGICGTLSSSVGGSAIAGADCVVAFGASLNRFTAGAMAASAMIIHCDTDPSAIGAATPVNVGLVGDVRTTAELMLEGLRNSGIDFSRGASSELETAIASYSPHDDFEEINGAETIDWRTAVVRLDSLLPPDRVVVTDTGRSVHAVWRYMHVTDPMNFVQTTNFASIGLGLGTAIGAAVGCPDQRVFAILGDGGFMMNVAGFSTAVAYRIPLVVIVANDHAYGAEYRKLREYGADPKYSLSEWPDLARLAKVLGGQGITVRSVPDLDRLPSLIADLTGPLLVDVRIDPSIDTDVVDLRALTAK